MPATATCTSMTASASRPRGPGPQSRMQENAAVAQYRLLQQRIGTTRTVIVTPAAYVTDNRVTLDGIEQLGARTRAASRWCIRP